MMIISIPILYYKEIFITSDSSVFTKKHIRSNKNIQTNSSILLFQILHIYQLQSYFF